MLVTNCLGPVSARRARGFTLVEVLLVMVIVGIISAFAVPSMASFIAGQRVKTASYDLFSTLIFARSEAIKRNVDVVVTASGGNWADGWTVAVGGRPPSPRSRPTAA